MLERGTRSQSVALGDVGPLRTRGGERPGGQGDAGAGASDGVTEGMTLSDGGPGWGGWTVWAGLTVWDGLTLPNGPANGVGVCDAEVGDTAGAAGADPVGVGDSLGSGLGDRSTESFVTCPIVVPLSEFDPPVYDATLRPASSSKTVMTAIAARNSPRLISATWRHRRRANRCRQLAGASPSSASFDS